MIDTKQLLRELEINIPHMREEAECSEYAGMVSRAKTAIEELSEELDNARNIMLWIQGASSVFMQDGVSDLVRQTSHQDNFRLIEATLNPDKED